MGTVSMDAARPSAGRDWGLIAAMTVSAHPIAFFLGLALIGLSGFVGDWGLLAPPVAWTVFGLVAAATSRFTANFARLGFHQGFGISLTLPAVVGRQRALELLTTGRRVEGPEALAIGLCDRLDDDPRAGARTLAAELAGSAPLAVRSIRATLRREVVDGFAAIVDHERSEQLRLMETADFREGIAASTARRPPEFRGE